ncbi:hypothetical protein M3Y95_01187700 [Aphelenchoides besseyi]|nr:hypothetical protein M3Y95_01187700 [Aphelenchoides besseyi]
MLEKRILEAETQVENAVAIWTHSLSQVYSLVLPVLVNLILTLSSWVYVYEMKSENLTVPVFLLDRAANMTTGNDIYDGMLNGLICVGSVGSLSFVMLTFALYDFRRLIQCWLSLSSLVLMFCVSSTFFNRLTVRLFAVTNPFVVGFFTLIYGTVGCLAFFTNRLPLVFHQVYVVSNCSLVSLFYLQLLPNHTTWFLLACIVLWDIFAVLTPIGPLRQVMDKAQDYSEDVLRFLMFTTAEEEATQLIEEVEVEEKIKYDVVESDDCSTADEISETWDLDGWSTPVEQIEETIELEVKKTTKTAHDALNDSSARLGMGDFVFYSLLVGKAATSGSVVATLAAAIGVINGLIFTLTAWTDGDETLPALPVSIFFGMLLHFGSLYLIEPMLQLVVLVSFWQIQLLLNTPALAIFVKIVAKDPLRVILFFLGAFFWLLSVLISGLFALPFSANILPIVFISALIQEAARVGYFSLLHRAQKDLEKVAANEVEVFSLRLSFASRHVLAVVCGLGIGVISALFILINVLADYSSEGIVGLPASISKDSEYLSVDQASFPIFFSVSNCLLVLDHVAWTIILWDACHNYVYRLQSRWWMGAIVPIIAHLFNNLLSTFATEQKSIALIGQVMVFVLSSLHCYLILRKPTRFVRFRNAWAST